MFDTPQRNHPTYILERIGAYCLFLFLLLGNLLTAGTQNIADILTLSYWKNMFAQLMNGHFSVFLSTAGAIVFLLVVICVSVLRWNRTFFHIEGDLLFSERRTIIRKLSKLPVSSITTVNVEQNVFEKLVGTAKVKIDINSAVTANKTDFVFILSKDRALQFKDILLALRDAEKVQTEELPRQLLASFTIADAIRHKLVSVPFVQILTAVVVFLPMFLGETAETIQDALTALVLSAVMYAASLVFGVLNLANFRLETDSKRIYISHGMLRTQNYAFEKNRVKAVFLKQSLLARLFGLCSVELAVVGLGNEKNESPRLCLLVKKERAEQLISTLLPAYSTRKEPTVSSHHALIPAFLITLLCTVGTALLELGGNVLYGDAIRTCGIPTALVFVAGSLTGILSQKTRTVIVEDNLFCCSSGILNKKTGRFRYGDLQEIRLHSNVLMQKKNIGKIGFSILSAKNVSAHKTGWFNCDVFAEVSRNVLAAPDQDIY